MGTYYKLLNFPKIPSELLTTDLLEADRRKHLGLESNGDRIKYKVGEKEFYQIVYNIGYPANDSLVEWVVNSLTPPNDTEFNRFKWARMIRNRIRIRFQEGSSTVPMGFRVHADYNAVAALMFFWDTGGDDVTTSWWKWKNDSLPLVSKTRSFRDNPYISTEKGVLEYKDLEMVESVNAVPFQWYLYCGSVLHDVQNVTGTRKYVSVSFKTFEELYQLGFSTFGITEGQFYSN